MERKAWELVQEVKHRLGISLTDIETDRGADENLYQPVKDDLKCRIKKLQEVEDFLFKLKI